MALITDPDLLEDSAADDGSQEVYINTAAKTIKLVQVGNLSTDGVTLKCLYSFLKEEWRLDPNTKNLAAFPFPMVPITDESFEFVDGWDFNADSSRYLIRNSGWTVKNTAGNTTQKWSGIIGLGSIEADDQLYFYQNDNITGSVNFQLQGQVNQAVQILSDPNGDANYSDGFNRTGSFSMFVRQQAQIYDKASLSDIGVTKMDSIAYRFPITTQADLNVTHADNVVSASSPYTFVGIKYFPIAFRRDIDATNNERQYGIVVEVGTHTAVDGTGSSGTNAITSSVGGISGSVYDGGTVTVHSGSNKGIYSVTSTTATTVVLGSNLPATQASMSFTIQRASPIVATAEEIYEKIQFLLRTGSDIDQTTGAVTGTLADELLEFVGTDLKCGSKTPINPNGGGSGVLIEGFKASDTNRLEFFDNNGISRTYPFVASLTINFGDNLRNDSNARYWVYFTTLPGAGNDFGESGAIIVDDNSNIDMAGSVGGAASVEKTFNYDGNVQGGRTPGTDAGITVVGIGLTTGQYVKAQGTIARSTSNTVSLIAPLERNYENT